MSLKLIPKEKYNKVASKRKIVLLQMHSLVCQNLDIPFLRATPNSLNPFKTSKATNNICTCTIPKLIPRLIKNQNKIIAIDNSGDIYQYMAHVKERESKLFEV